MKTNLDYVLEAGSILVIEQGSFSDKVWDAMRVTKRVTKRELVEAYKLAWASESSIRTNKYDIDYDVDEGPRSDCFLPWLAKSGYVEDADAHQWCVGRYGDFEP